MCIFNSLKFDHLHFNTFLFVFFFCVQMQKSPIAFMKGFLFFSGSVQMAHKTRAPRKSRLIRDQFEMIINIGAFSGESFPFVKSFVCEQHIESCNDTLAHTHTEQLFCFDLFCFFFLFVVHLSEKPFNSDVSFGTQFSILVTSMSSPNPAWMLLLLAANVENYSTFGSKMYVVWPTEPLSDDRTIHSNVFFYSKTHPSSYSDHSTFVTRCLFFPPA